MKTEKIKNIQDDTKRWWALGFAYCFNRKAKTNQTGIAMEADVPVSSLSAIPSGDDQRQPGPEIRKKLSRALNHYEYELMYIGKQIEDADYDMDIEVAELGNTTSPHCSQPEDIDLDAITTEEFKRLRAGTDSKSLDLLYALFKSLSEDQRRIIMNTMMGFHFENES